MLGRKRIRAVHRHTSPAQRENNCVEASEEWRPLPTSWHEPLRPRFLPRGGIRPSKQQASLWALQWLLVRPNPCATLLSLTFSHRYPFRRARRLEDAREGAPRADASMETWYSNNSSSRALPTEDGSPQGEQFDNYHRSHCRSLRLAERRICLKSTSESNLSPFGNPPAIHSDRKSL